MQTTLLSLLFLLRIDGSVQTLTPDAELPADGKNRTFILLDDDRRILALKRLPSQRSSLAELEPRNFRVGLFGGGGMGDKTASHSLLMGRNRTYASLDLAYQPTSLGVVVAVEDRDYRGTKSGLKTTYGATGVRVGAVKTFVLVPDGGWALSRWHLDLHGGAMRMSHAIHLSDAHVTVDEKIVAYAPYIGADVRYVIPGNVWFTARYQASSESLNFRELGVSVTDRPQFFAVGVQYAF